MMMMTITITMTMMLRPLQFLILFLLIHNYQRFQLYSKASTATTVLTDPLLPVQTLPQRFLPYHCAISNKQS